MPESGNHARIVTITTEAEDGLTLLIHGGAGSRGNHNAEEVDRDLNRALDAGYAKLEAGASAEEAVIAAIHVMEDAPEFNAGHGAALTSDGIVQMDACLMDGDGSVGAATGLGTARNPIDVAQAVKDKTKHVLFAEPTDQELADWGIETEDNEYFITDERRRQLVSAQNDGDEWEKHGTIGAVARDGQGHLAAATSTGGITNQMHGRVGDTPLPGCGTYANDETAAISGTGIGEAFIKAVAANQIASRVRFAGQDVEDAAKATLDEIDGYHGDGGVIVLPATGHGVIAYNSETMKFGFRSRTESEVHS
ncbi:isoaspartyl peptidase/L-asparaginase [Bifidobacterium sp. ESL0798]|uniref:isoaspartyl peptidase/L-asparaginase family protein n=1 Tax=Bifidobacterium sp. ESL0798 TaxID=2983235 RepID=UPI0023F96E85|nr:isoaspartyl peptidase/L-asparaginase [Bifidobacterium sp. ESL0798]WEV73681.1 isoaspartyl peptidase/L-asparaginase [Bifidobacterium sp. ESL0798]